MTTDYNSSDVLIEDTLSFKDLLSDGAKFTLQSNFQADDDSDIFHELQTGEDGFELKNEHIVSPWDNSFDELRAHMTEIGNDIYKRIVKDPINNKPIEGKCRVLFHYSAYLEKSAISYDSSFLRGDAYSAVTENMDLLPGLELAVKSMCEGEEAQFVIPYQLLLGELGCLTRVPPKSDSLFVIKLLKFNPVGDIEATEKVNEADRRKYYVMLPKILEVKASGIDHFNQGSWLKAAAAFDTAIVKLKFCHMRDETEEFEQKKHLLKLYANVMICFNKLDRPKKTCSMFNDAKRICNPWSNAKILFQYGKALMSLGEYNQSKHILSRAHNLQPTNKDISNHLRLLNEKHESHKNFERNLYRRACGNKDEFTPPTELNEKNKDSREIIKKFATEFKQNDRDSKMALPEGLTRDELSDIENVIKDMGLKLCISETYGKKNYYLYKLKK